MEQTWKPFWFESNAVSGKVDSLEKWEEIKSAWYQHHESDEDIYKLKNTSYYMGSFNTKETFINFGSRKEHRGIMSLGEFFDLHKMEKI